MMTVGCQIVEILYAKRLDKKCWRDILLLGCAFAFAVQIILIDEMGGLSQAIEKLYALIEEQEDAT